MRPAGFLRNRLAGAVAPLWTVFRQQAYVLLVHRHFKKYHAEAVASVLGLHRQPGCHHSASPASHSVHLLPDLADRSPTYGESGSQDAIAQRANRGEEENDEADGGQVHGLTYHQQVVKSLEEGFGSFQADDDESANHFNLIS